MKILTIDNTQLLKNFFTNIIDIRCDDNFMIRYNVEDELKAFCECDIEKMKESLIEENYMFVNDEFDVLIVTSHEKGVLFTLMNSEVNW